MTPRNLPPPPKQNGIMGWLNKTYKSHGFLYWLLTSVIMIFTAGRVSEKGLNLIRQEIASNLNNTKVADSLTTWKTNFLADRRIRITDNNLWKAAKDRHDAHQDSILDEIIKYIHNKK